VQFLDVEFGMEPRPLQTANADVRYWRDPEAQERACRGGQCEERRAPGGAGRAKMTLMYGPAVCRKKFFDPAVAVLHQCIRPHMRALASSYFFISKLLGFCAVAGLI